MMYVFFMDLSECGVAWLFHGSAFHLPMMRGVVPQQQQSCGFGSCATQANIEMHWNTGAHATTKCCQGKQRAMNWAGT